MTEVERASEGRSTGKRGKKRGQAREVEGGAVRIEALRDGARKEACYSCALLLHPALALEQQPAGEGGSALVSFLSPRQLPQPSALRV